MEPSDLEQEKIERLRRAMYSRTLADKLRPRDRRELEPSHESAPDDFVHREAEVERTMVAPRGISAMRNVLSWVLGIAIVFFVAAVGFFFYYFLFGAGSLPASPDNIAISISGPPQVQGGNRTELQIVVQNHNRAPLQNAELVLSYPDGTRSPDLESSSQYSCSGPEGTSDSSLSLPQQRICLGDIAAGGVRQGTIAAIFNGTEGQHQTIKADLEYRLAGSNALFVASSQYDLAYGSSPLSISVDGDTQTISGQPVQLTVNVSSNAAAAIRDVLLSADFPFGFTMKSANPPAGAGNFWQLGDLSPGQKTSVVIQGTLNGQTGDNRVFHFTAGTRATTTDKAIATTLADITQTMTISQPFLGLTVSVNGSASSTTIVSPGDEVTVNIGYQNNLQTPITNAIIVAKLAGVQIDGTSVHSTDGFYRSSDASMLWDRTTETALSSLAPGQKGTLSFTFQMPTADQLKSVNAPKLSLSINAAGNRVGESGVPETLLSNIVQNIGIASELSYTAQGLYYSNPFGSTGPLPPKAGQETTYALVFTVTNTTSKITNAVLTAQMPPYVRWLNRWAPPHESISFNQLNGTLTWNIGDIDPGVGLNGVPPRQVAIAVGFTPSTSQIGQVPALLQNVSLTGIDSSTGQKITLPVVPDTVTTDLTKVSKSSQSITAGIDAGFTSTAGTVVQ